MSVQGHGVPAGEETRVSRVSWASWCTDTAFNLSPPSPSVRPLPFLCSYGVLLFSRGGGR